MDQSPETVNPPPSTMGGLRRSTRNRIFAGVAGGLGERFDLDANLVRVGFVVLTFLWGIGLVVYLAMWVLIPRADGSDVNVNDVNAEPARTPSRWTSIVLLVGVIVLALIVLSARGGLPSVGGGLSAAWLLLLVVLAVVALRSPARVLTLRRAVAVLLLVAVSIAVVLSGATLAFLASTGVPLRGGSGARTWQPTSIVQVHHSYQTDFGRALVDLSSVNFPPSGYSVSATVGVGELDVVVPANAVVDLRTHVGIGTLAYSSTSGQLAFSRFEEAPSFLVTAAQRSAAPHLTLDAEVGIGRIVITRAGP